MLVRNSHKKTRKKLIWYFLFLLILGVSACSYYLFNTFRSTKIISPLAEKDKSSDLKEKLKIAKIPFSFIDFNYYFFTITLAQGEVLMSPKKNIDEQISSLQRILRELTIEGKPFKSIDFRFEKPVIEFREK